MSVGYGDCYQLSLDCSGQNLILTPYCIFNVQHTLSVKSCFESLTIGWKDGEIGGSVNFPLRTPRRAEAQRVTQFSGAEG